MGKHFLGLLGSHEIDGNDWMVWVWFQCQSLNYHRKYKLTHMVDYFQLLAWYRSHMVAINHLLYAHMHSNTYTHFFTKLHACTFTLMHWYTQSLNIPIQYSTSMHTHQQSGHPHKQNIIPKYRHPHTHGTHIHLQNTSIHKQPTHQCAFTHRPYIHGSSSICWLVHTRGLLVVHIYEKQG